MLVQLFKYFVFLLCSTLWICSLRPIGHFGLHITIVIGIFLDIGYMIEGSCEDEIVEPNLGGRGITNIEMETIYFL